MNNKVLVVALIVVVAIAIGGYSFPNVTERVTEKVVTRLGANAGPDFFDHLRFKQGFTKGGDSTATTTVDTTIVLGTGHQFNERTSYVSMNIGINATVTSMASTSAPLSNLAVGESLEVLFYNASTTAAATATFAAGTGVDLQEDEGETVIVNGLEVARLTFVKKADTDVILWVEPGQVGD